MNTRISWLDVKLGLRMMARHPALTLVGGLGLAVGIAVSVGFYTFSSIMMYPDLPLDEGDRIVALENRDVAINNEDRQALHDFVTWRDELTTIHDLTAFRTVEHNFVTGNGTPELVRVAEMTAAGFDLARIPPLLGRVLVASDEAADAPPVLVIGESVWRDRFAGDAAVIGRDVRLGNTVHTIVGVMPDGFAFPESHRFWTALRADPSAYERGAGPAIYIAGRLAPGVTMEQAQAELSTIGERMAAEYPSNELLRPMVMPYTHSLTDVQGTSVWMVVQMNLMMSLLLVVIALNVAVLIYARTAARQGEIAMRNALGASRGRIVAQLFAEGLVLSLAAAGAGLLLAQFGIGLGMGIIETETGVVPFWMDAGMKPGTVLFTVGMAVFAAVIIGVLPGWQATRRGLAPQIREQGNGMRLGRTWTALIVGQVAIAVAALPAAVNMGWSEIRAALTLHNYAAQEFVTASLAPAAEEAATATAGDGVEASSDVAFATRLTRLLTRLEDEPDVAGASYMAWLPEREGAIQVEDAAGAEAEVHRVTAAGTAPGYTDLLGVSMLSGRPLSISDAGPGGGVVVTESFVRRVLNGEPALGRRIRHVSEAELAGEDVTRPARWYEIVGVVQDLQVNRVAPELVRPAVYYAVAPDEVQRASLIVRMRGSTVADFGPRLRQVTAEVDPALRLSAVRSLADSDRQRQLAARLVGLAVGLVLLSVLLLSAAGIYAMMSFTVTQRRREIGIRSALGAQPRQVLRNVFARAARQVGLGVAIGLLAGAAMEWLSGGGLVGGRAVLLPALALTMGLVGLLAAYGPARRGLRIQPTEALRGDG